MSETNTHEFAIQRLYVKDSSYEAPNTPEVFRNEWKPEINLDLHTEHKKIEDNLYEVILRVTVTAKQESKNLFVAEVKHAGIFLLKNFADTERDQVLGALCPNIIFPYLREVLTRLVNDGGFPPLYLAPINFEAIYAQKQKPTMQAH